MEKHKEYLENGDIPEFDSVKSAERFIEKVLASYENFDSEDPINGWEEKDEIDSEKIEYFQEACQNLEENLDQRIKELDDINYRDRAHLPVGTTLGAGIGYLAGEPLVGAITGTAIGYFTSKKKVNEKIRSKKYCIRTKRKLKDLENKYVH